MSDAKHDKRDRRRRLPRPTAALPGTPEKVEVLRLRFERSELLHHPHDARWDGEVSVATQADKRRAA